MSEFKEKYFPFLYHITRDIGPRPAGSDQEFKALQFIANRYSLGKSVVMEWMSFPTFKTWGYALIVPIFLSLIILILMNYFREITYILTFCNVFLFFLSFEIWNAAGGRTTYLTKAFKIKKSQNLLIKIPDKTNFSTPAVIFIAHVDSNKHRISFSPSVKRSMRLLGTFLILSPMISGVIFHLSISLDYLSLIYLSFTLIFISLMITSGDEFGGFVEGANDNGSAIVVCTAITDFLSKIESLNKPVWILFTGSEEVGCLGIHHFLDEYGPLVKDSYFIDFEMVGSENIVVAERHSGFSYLTTYHPDSDLLNLSDRITKKLSIEKRTVVLGEEIGSLQSRGFKGLCLVGQEQDGWMRNWHQHADRIENLEWKGIHTSYQFSLMMLTEMNIISNNLHQFPIEKNYEY